MRRLILGAGLLLCGCYGSGAYMNVPAWIRNDPPPPPLPNPAYMPLGPGDYACLFESVIGVVDDYFEIAYANRYDGTIRTFPRVAPGLGQPWKPGSPDGAERLLATAQSIRYRCDVVIQPGEQGGYLVYLTVFRELEDVPQPIRSSAGVAAFRSDNSVDRTYEVIDPSVIESNWIPKGREDKLEQMMLDKIARCVPRR